MIQLYDRRTGENIEIEDKDGEKEAPAGLKCPKCHCQHIIGGVCRNCRRRVVARPEKFTIGKRIAALLGL